MPTPPRPGSDDQGDQAASDARPPSELDLDVLRASLERPERIERVAAAVGCVLVLTDRRFVIVRDGAHIRPATGLRSWPRDHRLDVKVVGTGEGASRVEISGTGADMRSVFVRKAQVNAVAALIRDLRARS